MLIRNKKTFTLGVIFAISFAVVFLVIILPVFGDETGLQYADESFNKLSKGSSYFIPKVSQSVEKFADRQTSVNIKFDKPADAEAVASLLKTSGATVQENVNELKIEGTLGGILSAAIRDSDEMYNNNGKAVSDRYGLDEKNVMRYWWAALSKMEKALKKAKLVAEANIISDVNKKAVEPAYNFYGVEANRVSDHAGMLSGLLIFYVIYTLWWGYAIFYMFDGIGLSMKKAKVKKEV